MPSHFASNQKNIMAMLQSDLIFALLSSTMRAYMWDPVKGPSPIAGHAPILCYRFSFSAFAE